MSIEFDIACLRAPIDASDPIGVVQLIARASAAADQIETLISQRDELLAALKGLTDGKCIDLGDLVYNIRAREGEGWEGPKVVAWGKAVKTARSLIQRIEASR